MEKFKIENFQKMLDWSKGEFKQLPWRKRRSPYKTLVSEIMLQQTTVKTVEQHFKRFLDIYPDISSLANSNEEKVQIAWKGLGYYRRARNLLKAAKAIKESYNGEIPKVYEDLINIPGIGDYTASALVSIGYNQKAIALDANISRVLSRFWNINLKGLSPLKQNRAIKEVFNKKFSKVDSFKSYRALNESLMDVGRVFCQARKASCSLCPLKSDCESYRGGHVKKLIAEKEKKISKYFELELVRFIIRNAKGELLMLQKNKGEWLEGQFELPTFILRSEDENLKQYPVIKKTKLKTKREQQIKSAITKYKIVNFYNEISKDDFLLILDRKKVSKSMKWMESKDKRIAHVSQKIINEYWKKYE